MGVIRVTGVTRVGRGGGGGEGEETLQAHRPIKGNTRGPRGPKNETVLRTIPCMNNLSNQVIISNSFTQKKGVLP